MNANSKYLRMYAVAVDRYGVDPINDKIVPHIQSIKTYTLHEVTAEERGAPDLISLNAYGAEDYWWMILAYNGIGSYKSIVEGTTLKLPDFASLVAAVNQNAIRPNKIARVISI